MNALISIGWLWEIVGSVVLGALGIGIYLLLKEGLGIDPGFGGTMFLCLAIGALAGVLHKWRESRLKRLGAEDAQ
jgi:hypothetical protein